MTTDEEHLRSACEPVKTAIKFGLADLEGNELVFPDIFDTGVDWMWIAVNQANFLSNGNLRLAGKSATFVLPENIVAMLIAEESAETDQDGFSGKGN
ncbi:MAG: hypothetical protein ACE5JU_15610 [Candidatus Binatia bacterium]